MKQIRHIATALLFITAILHFIPLFTQFDGPYTFPMLAFGLAYAGVGYLLCKNKPIGKFLGILIPMIGLGAGVLQIGYENWNTLLKILFSIDALVIICCILLLNKRR